MIAYIKKIIPKQILLWRMTYLTYGADVKKYFRIIKKKSSIQDIYLGKITANYHVIEKGLTMPEPRLGFGENQILYLCRLLNEYNNLKFDTSVFEIDHAARVLNEYIIFHRDCRFNLKPQIIEIIQETTTQLNCYNSSLQLNFTKEDYLKSVTSAFPEFSQSRHSVRNYSQERIPIDELMDAVRLAQNSPSSCNRQPVRIYIVTKKSVMKDILELQGGNRGFGHLAAALYVVTTNNLLFPDVLERWQAPINAGFFGMALLYALHSKKIGAVALNWSKDYRYDNKLRDLINIPENEQIQFVVSCGYLLGEFKVAAAPRMNVESICKIID